MDLALSRYAERCQESAIAVALREVTQDEVGTVRYGRLWQDAYLISEHRVGLSKSLILRNCHFQAVASLLVSSIYLLPGRCKEHPKIEPMALTKCDQCLLTGQMLKGNGSIDQASVKKYPPTERLGQETIGKSHIDQAPRERNSVAPWESRSVGLELLLHDSATRFLYDCMPATTEFGEQRGLAAARAPGDYDEAIHFSCCSLRR
jgi:hypothetical protein